MTTATTTLLKEQAQRLGLTASEYDTLVAQLGRTPTLEEIAVMGAMWSEHCSYKSSKVHLKRFHTSEPWVLQGPGENAGIVAINEEWAVAFKMESHNHPSFIEPYQGAATGVGGILRDVFCMGARPIAAANALRFGIGSDMMRLVKGVVRGIGDYGNSFGVPTVTGETVFHERYSKNILVNAFAAGVVHRNKIFRGTVAEGNVLIYYGQPTGRDGVHGATMSSDEFSSGTQTLKPTVQVGCPFSEKKLLEATMSLLEKNLVVGLQDMGAAGLTSSGAEMAARSQLGALIDLEKVPMRATNLKPFELLLSESQERMLCAVDSLNVDAVLELLKTAGVSFAVVGTVTTSQRFQCRWHGAMVVDLPNDVIENAPPRENALQPREEYLKEHSSYTVTDEAPISPEACADAHGLSFSQWMQKHTVVFQQLLEHQNFCSRDPLTQHYDGSVQSQTLAGCQSYFHANAALVRLPPETTTTKSSSTTQHCPQTSAAEPALAIAVGCKEQWTHLDPMLGAEQSVVHLARKIYATGARPLALTDCLNFGSLAQPAISRQFSDTVDGINKAARALRIPVVSGNVSLNNQTNGKAILPTPMIGVVGLHDDARHFFKSAVSANQFVGQTIELYILTCQRPVFFDASSIALTLSGRVLAAALPPVDYALEKRSVEILFQLFELSPAVVSCVGKGGLAITLSQIAERSERTLSWSAHAQQMPAAELFSEGQNQWIIGFAGQPTGLEAFENLIQQEGFWFEHMGSLLCVKTVATPAVATQLHRYFEGT